MTLPMPIEMLRARLASGEISTEEYRKVLAVLQETDAPPEKAPPEKETQGEVESGRPGPSVLSACGMDLRENGVLFEGVFYPLATVSSVRGGERSRTVNLVAFERSTALYIGFVDGRSISLRESRAWFAGRNHANILRLFEELRVRTYRPRFINLVLRLRQHGELTLHTPFLDEDSVVLDVSGVVRTPKRGVNLKAARESGTFGLGTERHSINMLNSRIDSAEVVISESKGMLGQLIPRDALRFTPTVEDVDVVHTLLAWLAEPGNTLTALNR